MTAKKKTVSEFTPHPGRENADKQIKELQEQLRIAEQKVARLSAVSRRYKLELNSKNKLKLGVLSDLHIGSLCCNEDAIVSYYQTAVKQGVRTFLCAGDLLDGHRIYRGQEFELRELGYAKQKAAFVKLAKRLPKNAITYFVTGNHDASFKRLSGALVGEAIDKACDRWHYLGEDIAQFEINTPQGLKRLAMLHPDGGTAYALSYKPQKIVDAWAGGSKPHLLAIGHYHKAEFIPRYRNVKILQAGTFQEQTPFMARKGLAADVGGWIVEWQFGELCNEIGSRFVEFF